ncbi:MAG: hybrid sensor histidine kinase/response regulator [Planctomycetota bacterium]
MSVLVQPFLFVMSSLVGPMAMAAGGSPGGPVSWMLIPLLAAACVLFVLLWARERRRRCELMRTTGARSAVENQAQRRSAQDLRLTLDAIAEAVIAVDVDGRIEQLNPVAAQLLGSDEQHARGRPLSELVRLRTAEGTACLIDPLTHGRESGRGLPASGMLVLPDETLCPVEWRAAARRNEHGAPVGAVLVLADVTEKQRLEDELRHAQKMEAIGQLAGGIAHDFNNMLGGILGSAELLAEHVGPDARSQRMVEMIVKTVDRAVELTNKLLAFSHRGRVDSTAVDLHALLENTRAMLQRVVDRRIRIGLALEADSHAILGDPAQLQAALLHICLNARDAMPEGGELRIETADIAFDQTYCEASAFDLRPGTYIQVVIRDTGTGMSRETQRRAFEPFFTTKATGTGSGLGLAAVYSTVADHHGAVALYSELEAGTAVHVYLPVEDRADLESSYVHATIVPGTGTVLVVDDEEVIRCTAEEMLATLGYEVLLAEDGQEAVELFREHGTRIDVVLLDMVMPRLGGAETFQAIRAMDPAARIVVSSGFTRGAAVEALREEGLAGYVKKPFTIAELSHRIAKAKNRSA